MAEREVLRSSFVFSITIQQFNHSCPSGNKFGHPFQIHAIGILTFAWCITGLMMLSHKNRALPTQSLSEL